MWKMEKEEECGGKRKGDEWMKAQEIQGEKK